MRKKIFFYGPVAITFMSVLTQKFILFKIFESRKKKTFAKYYSQE